MTNHVDRYETWSDLLDYVETSERSPGSGRESDDSHDEKWSGGTTSLNDAINVMRKGWPSGVEKALAISERIESQLYNLIERPRISYDVSGELLDVARYCMGEPEHWGIFQTDLVEGQGHKHVKLVINIGASCMVKPETIIARGAVAAALVNLLELAGHRAEVTAVCASRGDNHSVYTYTVIKRFDDTLDLDRLTAAVAHPSNVRRIQFKHREALPTELAVATGSGSYGTPIEAESTERGDVYFPCMFGHGEDGQWSSPETSVSWTRAKLIELGIIKSE
jgi:hypothetical protein